MAEGIAESAFTSNRKPYAWTEIFRCFQVALDPRKLLVAAAGILAMSVGWYLLSVLFWHDRPNRDRDEYIAAVKAEGDWAKKPDAEVTLEAFKRYEKDLNEYVVVVARESEFKEAPKEKVSAEATVRYNRDLAQYKLLRSLAGPGGKIRSMPWSEYRGKNPYEFLTGLSAVPSSAWIDSGWAYMKAQLPVMLEPLAKLFLPVVKITDPNASLATRFYLFLVMAWNVLVWAFAGGVITRIAAVQLSGKDRVSIGQAANFVLDRYLSYALAPIVPIGVVGAVVVGICILGLVCLIPVLGDLILGLGMPLIILGGIIMTIIFIGLIGYPLMTATLSTEGSDTFDALSRAYNYVFQSPWSYAWNWIVAIVYGTIVTFVVILIASLMVYLGKWALSATPLTETTNQNRDYLFIYTPESFGWRELLLKGSDLEGYNEAKTNAWIYTKPEAAAKYEASIRWWNWLGTGLTTFWVCGVFLLMLGFSYSFFWSAATMIYLLMRNQVDEVELDEVFLEEDDPLPPPPASPMSPPPPTPPVTAEKPASLPMVPPPPPPLSTEPPSAVPPVEPSK